MKFTRLKAFIVLAVLWLCSSTAFANAGADEGQAPDMTHRMMVLAIQLGLILIAARLGNMLLQKWRMPGVVGELLAGVLIGPYLLGAVPLSFLGFPDGLFYVDPLIMAGDFPISPELYGICAVASIVLLFMVGLETDLRLFMRYSLAGTLVGVGGVAVSFVLGDLTAVLLFRIFFKETVGFLSAPCLLLGIISTATSVGITARLLSEKRKLDSPEGVTILAGAVIDDVLGIILLAIGMGVITASQASGGINWGHIALIALKAVGVWLAATAAGLLAARKISTLLKWFKERSAIAIMALGLALILAGLFEEAGLAMIVGAYVMGLSLSRSDIRFVVAEKVHPVSVFFVPVFFTVMGMLVNVRLLMKPEVLLFGLIYTLVAAASKIIGCGVPALFCNFNMRGALRIGAGMLPRGEVTLIIAGVGLAAGLLDQSVFGVVVFMTLAAAMFAPPLVVKLFSHPGSGLRVEGESKTESALKFSFPSKDTADMLVAKLFHVFESEGFFVHTIDRRLRICQLLKDDVVIGFQQKGTDIAFDCMDTEIPMVSAAMYEVVGELEQTLNELRKPVDAKAIVRRLQSSVPPSRAGMARMPDYVSRDLLNPALTGDTKEEIIRELLGMLDAKGLIANFDEALNAVLQREAGMSTGMQYGIAVPHGRTDVVHNLICAVGLKREGMDFDSIDGEPTRIFVLTLSPISKPAPHVQFMSTISQILNAEGREALLEAETAEGMYDTLIRRRALSGAAQRKTSVVAAPRQELQPGLARYLRPELVAVDLPGETKADIIRELINIVAREGLISDVESVFQTIMNREAQMSTGLEHGIAIPHGRTTAVGRLICAVGIKKQGIAFDAIDGQPSQIFVLTLSPPDAADPHIQFMAMVSRILDEEGRARVLGAPDRDALFHALGGQ
jgi:Kef-type K+ transport system membrane component KefB/mannitol/fructose-specific phosphotransferase system IIA component (Ntr-type)